MTQTVQAEMQASDNIGANLIINGDMRIAQRGTSFVSPASGAFLMDRYSIALVGAGAFTVTQDTDVPSGEGFLSSMKVDVTTADATLAASDQYAIQYKVEGLNMQHLMFGSANAKTMTLTFWVKSTVTGTQYVTLANNARDRCYPAAITINVSDTWEKKTITFTGATDGTWLTTNGVGLSIIFNLAYGSNFEGGTADTWATSNIRGPASAANLVDNIANNIFLTGVKLEVGSTATDFVPDDYATALAKCQRYYEKSYNAGVNPGSGSLAGFFAGQIENTSTNGDKLPGPSYKVSKRTSATVTTYGISGTAGTFSNGGGTDLAASSCTVNIPGTEGFVPYQNSGGNVTTTNRACWYHWVADAEL